MSRIDSDGRDLLDLTEALCAVPSVSGDEGALADAIEEWVRDRAKGLEITRLGNNVVVRTSHGRARRIALGGHLDTVPPNGNSVPKRDGDTLHGLGSADMKGGLAALLRIAEGAATGAPRHDCTLIFYEGEEIADEHNGLRRLFAERPDLTAADFAILLEPTGGWVEAGCQGTIHVRATYRGRRAHSARPWMGENAIHKAAALLTRVDAAGVASVDVEGLEFRESLQVVRIDGGVANNVVPDECHVVVNRRYAPSRTLDAAVDEVRALCADADALEVLNASPAAAPNLAHPLVAEFTGAFDLAIRPKLGWTDVARFAQHGIAACNFGPGDPAVSHTADERVERADVEGCHQVLAAFLGIT